MILLVPPSMASCPWPARSERVTVRRDCNVGSTCTAAPTAQLTNGELEVRYQPGPEVLAELQDLVAEERVCCAFVSWAVTEDSGQPVLRVIAPRDSPQDIEYIAAMFAVTD